MGSTKPTTTDTKFFHPKKGHWKLEVSGEPKKAYINAYGVVPGHVKKDIEKIKESGMVYTFQYLEWIARLLTGKEDA